MARSLFVPREAVSGGDLSFAKLRLPLPGASRFRRSGVCVGGGRGESEEGSRNPHNPSKTMTKYVLVF